MSKCEVISHNYIYRFDMETDEHIQCSLVIPIFLELQNSAEQEFNKVLHVTSECNPPIKQGHFLYYSVSIS